MASALKDGMLLGGNLPDSLSQYIYPGHEENDEYEDNDHDDEDVAGVDTGKTEELDAEKSKPKA